MAQTYVLEEDNLVFDQHLVGEDYRVSVSPPPEMRVLTYEKDIMRTEVNVMKMLGDKTEIPIPKILGENFKRDIIDSFYLNVYLFGFSKRWLFCWV